jgi:hypothetical protein
MIAVLTTSIDSSFTISSPTKTPGHHSLTMLNRDLVFISITLSSIETNVIDADESISLLCERISLSFHQRQFDTRVRFGLERAYVMALSKTVIQCGYLEESSIARRMVKVVNNEAFVRVVAEVKRQNKSKSSVKVKLIVGPIELAAHSLVNIMRSPMISNLQALQIFNTKPKSPETQKPHSPDDVITKLINIIIGSTATDVSSVGLTKSHDIDLQLNSLNICLADNEYLSLLTLTGVNIRVARRLLPCWSSNTRGQVDLRVSNIQLYDLSKVRNVHPFVDSLNFVHNQLELCPFTGQPRDPRADWVPIIF